MEDLVKYLVCSLVENKDAVKIEREDTEDSVTLHVTVADDEMGRVIGKGGRVASAIRAIVHSVFGKEHKKIYVKFGE